MNNIEVLKEIEKYYAQDIIQKTETGKSKLNAIRSAISTLEAQEKLIKERDLLRACHKADSNEIVKLRAELSRIKGIGVEALEKIEKMTVPFVKDVPTLVPKMKEIARQAIHKLYGGK